MLTYIGLAVGCLCLIAFAVSLYFFNSKIKKHEETIQQMIAKQMRMEAIVSRPPPKHEITSLFRSHTKKSCDDCELEPVIPSHETSASPVADDDAPPVAVAAAADGGGLINPADDAAGTPSC